MKSEVTTKGTYLSTGVMALVALLGLYASSRYNYLLFHSVAELFSIVIAWGVFIIAWNSRAILEKHYLLLIGIAYLFVAGFDMLHTFAYKGMGVFPEYDANLPTQLWIAGRYTESGSLLLAAAFIRRTFKPWQVLTVYALTFMLLLASIFAWEVFPTCYVEGVGLTPFKIVSEYVICTILAASIILLVRNRKEFDGDVFRLLVWSMLVAMISELAFTFYVSVYGASNFLGHFLKIISFYLIYKAIVETGLVRPYNLLFRNLTVSEEALRKAHGELEGRVLERTAQLAEANRALRLSEAHFRRTFDQSPIGAAIVGFDYRFQRVNEALCRITGYAKEDLVGRTFAEITHPEDLKADMEQVERLCAGEIDQYNMEKRYLRKDAQAVWVDLHVRMVRDASGTPLHLLPMMEDITQRKLAQEELRAYTERLEQSNRELRDFTFVAAHDLQEPLRKIQIFGDRLGTAYADALDARGHDYLRRMQGSAARMRRLVNSLLDYSGIAIRQRTPRRVRLTEVIADTVADLEILMEETGGRVEVGELPEIEADESQMRQLFQNLISNALKYRQQEEVPLVHVSGSVVNGSCTILVQDNGIGFDEKYLHKIFRPFQQLHGRSEHVGMGLAICRKIVETHGGRITATSAPGHGATFIVTLPVEAVNK